MFRMLWLRKVWIDNQTSFPTEPVSSSLALSTWAPSCVRQLSFTLRTWLDRGTLRSHNHCFGFAKFCVR